MLRARNCELYSRCLLWNMGAMTVWQLKRLVSNSDHLLCQVARPWLPVQSVEKRNRLGTQVRQVEKSVLPAWCIVTAAHKR